MASKPFPNLFTPLKVQDKILKNRIMSAPNMLFHTVDGKPTRYYTGYLEHKAMGGAAIVNLGEVSVGDGGNHTPEMKKTRDNQPLFAELAAAIHEHGALASAELTHGGMKVRKDHGNSILLGPVDCLNSVGEPIKGMTEEDMDIVCRQYADTAKYILGCGFDTVLLHFGHGWLPMQFLSPLTNTRTDAYGGSLENRMRFPLMILKKVREAVGPRQMLMIRISGSDRIPGAYDVQDAIAFLEKAQEYIDLVEVSVEAGTISASMASTFLPLGLNTDLSEAIKKSGRVHIPVFSIGSILYPEQAEEIIASGKADGVSMSRALIADPFLPEKAFAGKADEITPCLRCLNCTDGDNKNRHMVCSVNPLIGREARDGFGDDIGKAKHPKRVLVVGGGPAGIQAAMTAYLRGHDVTLCEKSDSLGGLLNFTDNDSLKHDLRRYKDFIVRRIQKTPVRILLNTEATPALAKELQAEEVIIATGSTPVEPRFLKGWENASHASRIYFDPAFSVEDEVVMIGGGLIGIEAGLHLRKLGKKVTVLEMQDTFAPEAGHCYRGGLNFMVRDLELEIITGAKCLEITDDGVLYEKDGIRHLAPGKTVLYAVGMKANDAPYFDFAAETEARLSIVGDCKKVGKVDGAVHSAYFAAMDIGRF